MSLLLCDELNRADLTAKLPPPGQHLDTVLRAHRGEPGAAERREGIEVVIRALDNLTTSDLPAHGIQTRLLLTGLAMAASAPVLAALGQESTTSGQPVVGGYLSGIPSVVNPTEKSPTWAGAITGDTVVAQGWTTAAAAADIARQVIDLMPGALPELEEAFATAVDAALEGALLTRLAGTGTPAADFAAAFSACTPVATHLIGSPAKVLAAASAVGGASSLAALGLTILVTSNYAGALVIHAPACPVVIGPRYSGTEDAVALLGVDVGVWRYGIAAARVASACQVLA